MKELDLDHQGYFREVDGKKFRVVDVEDGEIVFMNPKIEEKRRENSDRIDRQKNQARSSIYEGASVSKEGYRKKTK